MRALRPWLWSALACAVLVGLSVAFLDRPIARFSHDAIGGGPVFLDLTMIPARFDPVSVLLVVACGLVAIGRGRLAGTGRILLLAALSYIVGIAVKNELKFVFGRTWPETWVHNNPSFIGTGAYGFHFFHGGAGWASFPSGHTTAITSVMAVLWLMMPRWRPLWAGLAVAVAVGLLGMDYHFLGDIIAGGFLGTAVGVGTVRIAGREAAGAAGGD
ncbi:MAG TPA: phosphatase PAP2 family protein [Acetobacteraceae bacterium]|nr:phosphatase PAP2 family protein [Acetobacteraceae bacterium]